MQNVDIILVPDSSSIDTQGTSNPLQGKWSISKGWNRVLAKLFPETFPAKPSNSSQKESVLVLTYAACSSLIQRARQQLKEGRFSKVKMSAIDDKGHLSNTSEHGLVELMLRHIEPWLQEIKRVMKRAARTMTAPSVPVPA